MLHSLEKKGKEVGYYWLLLFVSNNTGSKDNLKNYPCIQKKFALNFQKLRNQLISYKFYKIINNEQHALK